MATVTIRELARSTASVIQGVESSGRPALVTRNGKPVAALVPIDLAALEDWLFATESVQEDDVRPFLEELRKPAVTTLHTVLSQPPSMRASAPSSPRAHTSLCEDAPRDWLPLLTVAARGEPMAGPYDEGYPPSAEADLDPGPGLGESLEEADREVGGEHRTAPEGRRPDGSIEDEDRFEDADGVDDAEFRHQLAGGRS